MVQEIVTLVMKQVVFRHREFLLLENVLKDKYNFRIIEVRDFKIIDGIIYEPVKAHEKRIASLRKYETTFLDARIKVCIIGEVIQEHDILDGIEVADHHIVHTARYQMIKIESPSGYSIQHFIEELIADLGLDVREKEWIFTRVQYT